MEVYAQRPTASSQHRLPGEHDDGFESSIDDEPVTVRLAQRLGCRVSPRRQNRRSAQRSTTPDSVSPATRSRPHDTHCSLFIAFVSLMGMNREQLGQLSFDVLPERRPRARPRRVAHRGRRQRHGIARGGQRRRIGRTRPPRRHRGRPQPAAPDRDGARSVPQPASQLRVPADRGDAGIAPAVHVADPDAGIVVMDFIHQRPITEHPGGPVGVLRELGEHVARLQATTSFHRSSTTSPSSSIRCSR